MGYIDKEKFYKTMVKRFGCVPALTDYSSSLRNDVHLDEALNSIPVVDAVEVVRCKDCKHWHKCLSDDGSIEYIHFSRCIKGNQLANGNDYFCSYGKRKTD